MWVRTREYPSLRMEVRNYGLLTGLAGGWPVGGGIYSWGCWPGRLEGPWTGEAWGPELGAFPSWVSLILNTSVLNLPSFPCWWTKMVPCCPSPIGTWTPEPGPMPMGIIGGIMGFHIGFHMAGNCGLADADSAMISIPTMISLANAIKGMFAMIRMSLWVQKRLGQRFEKWSSRLKSKRMMANLRRKVKNQRIWFSLWGGDPFYTKNLGAQGDEESVCRRAGAVNKNEAARKRFSRVRIRGEFSTSKRIMTSFMGNSYGTERKETKPTMEKWKPIAFLRRGKRGASLRSSNRIDSDEEDHNNNLKLKSSWWTSSHHDTRCDRGHHGCNAHDHVLGSFEVVIYS